MKLRTKGTDKNNNKKNWEILDKSNCNINII